MDQRRWMVVGGLVGVVLLVAVDFALGDAGWPSWILTILEILAAIPWAAVVLGRPLARTAPPMSVRMPESAAQSVGRASAFKARALLAGVSFIALLVATLLLKVLLLSGTTYGAAELTHLYRTYTAMAVFVAALGYVGRGQRTVWFFGQIAEHPARMLAMSFLVVSMLGGFLLATPFALSDPTKGSFVDAWFDATGALCGALSVSDVGRHYLGFGQWVVLALMQIGGFGIMVLSASVALLAGRKLEVKSHARFAEVVDAESLADLRATVLRIVLWTLAIEAIGAIVLFFLFDAMPGIDSHPKTQHPLAGGGGALFSAVFHSVSAFCNAGFALFRGNLGPFVSDPAVNVVLCTLIVIGGIGFPVLTELGKRLLDLVARRPRKRLSLHARVVLAMSAALIVAGAVPILVLEWGGAFAKLPYGGRVLAALFQSITARSAGFSTIDLAALGAPTLLIMTALMFVGAGPGSTGGGIKVTTLAVLYATFRAEQQSNAAPTMFGREIPAATQRKAIVVTFLSALFVALAVFLVLIFEDQPPLFVLFDVTSAFGSVGCSTGSPEKMGAVGKLLLTATMLIGRIGPLTFALAAAGKPRPTTFRLPEERVMIG